MIPWEASDCVMPREIGNDWYAELVIQNVDIGSFSFDITFQMANRTNDFNK